MGKLVEKVCPGCGNSFTTKRKRKFCTRACYYRSLMGKPTWNAGLTKEDDPRIAKLATFGFQGKRHTEESKLWIAENLSGENNPMHSLSPEREAERVRKMSATLIHLYKSGELEHPRGMLGKPRSEAFKRHMSRIMTKKQADGEMYSWADYNSDPERFRDSSIEMALRDELEDRGVDFKAHVRMLGTPDILIGGKVAVFADGCYWHECPKHGKGRHLMAPAYDKKITEGLRKEGFVVIRFWQHEIVEDPAPCVDQIMLEVRPN